jgi:regulatory protein
MPIITALEPQQHDQERVNVYIDGSFAFGASLLVVHSRSVRVGRELNAGEIGALQHDDAVERAFAAALNFLSFRPRSRREVMDYFRRRKTEVAVASAVVERLERMGLIDDHQFARFWVENRQAFRPRGTRALRMEMRQKGLDSEVIEEALEGLTDEESTAYRAGERKARSLGALDDREFFRRMVAFLQRRGFPYAAAAAATKRLAELRGLTPSDELSEALATEGE